MPAVVHTLPVASTKLVDPSLPSMCSNAFVKLSRPDPGVFVAVLAPGVFVTVGVGVKVGVLPPGVFVGDEPDPYGPLGGVKFAVQRATP